MAQPDQTHSNWHTTAAMDGVLMDGVLMNFVLEYIIELNRGRLELVNENQPKESEEIDDVLET
eukprot:scaffold60711_cov65-Attheya_sp.AAC.9